MRTLFEELLRVGSSKLPEKAQDKLDKGFRHFILGAATGGLWYIVPAVGFLRKRRNKKRGVR